MIGRTGGQSFRRWRKVERFGACRYFVIVLVRYRSSRSIPSLSRTLILNADT